MPYRNDNSLSFLEDLKSSDLNDLVYCLTHDTDGEERFTEELTTRNYYKLYYPDHHKYWKDIACEIQCFGANTFATIFRGGEGVLYKEVLTDVCDKLDVNYNSNSNVEKIENNLLLKIIEESIEKMDNNEIKKLLNELGIKKYDIPTADIANGIFQAIFRMGGFTSYKLTLIVANAIWKHLFGKGLSLVANQSLTKFMSIWAGPIGWAITAIWTAIDIAGPAYRVTIPACIQVALLRKKYLYDEDAKNVVINI